MTHAQSLNVLDRAGIPATIVEHSRDRAEIRLLGIVAFDLDEVIEVIEEHYSDDVAGRERLLSEIEASTTFEQS